MKQPIVPVQNSLTHKHIKEFTVQNSLTHIHIKQLLCLYRQGSTHIVIKHY